jgi:hypothetical protein
MSTTLDADGMRLLTLQHGGCELARDWDGALATMGPEPFYEFYPWRLRISGPDPIRELWTRVFRTDDSETLRCFNFGHLDSSGHEMWEMVSDESIVHISNGAFFDEAGERITTTTIVRYRFAGDRMMSESLWACDNLRPYLDTVFDESFRALPGVEVI